ncbi:hypothetical protein JCM9957A_30350 [Kineosporia succinea]
MTPRSHYKVSLASIEQGRMSSSGGLFVVSPGVLGTYLSGTERASLRGIRGDIEWWLDGRLRNVPGRGLSGAQLLVLE